MKLGKVYEPNKYEEKIYKLWEEQGAFAPKHRGSDKSYSIVVPPPNANGDLHMGHGLTLAVEDIAVRYHRMKGEASLLLPGADHAGFESQVVYEKRLAKEGKSRFDFSREELYKRIWDFVALNKENYQTQFRQLGASVDWDRYVYTLDKKIISRAYETFKKMWDEGLVYRGERLVNFCTFHGTSFADIEVVHKEEAGKLYYLKYPLSQGRGHLVVATTRPETMLGDTAVAVHPKDKRYDQYIGKTIRLPLTKRDIPVVADEMVDRKFGTGAVKITPAHDQNDYEVAERHDLPKMTVIDFEGKMGHDVPEAYRGLTVEEARQKIVEQLREQGTLLETKEHQHSVGHCYKCDTVIQPLLKEQWFINMKPLAQEAIKALQDNTITFYPATKKKQLITYLEGLKDWNISRQIAWGIPIPAFQNVADPDDWVFDERVDQEEIEVDSKTYRRDPDVFDTWFSSSSWPYATLDYPDGADFSEFYPLSLMETGGEILYPWVSRMIMLGLYITGQVPFEAVYIHGYVMAEDGSKMSKSVGNVVAPIPVIEKYGSDALRMGIVSGRSPAVNRGYDPRRIEDARNFANKLWNIARFVQEAKGDAEAISEPWPQTPADNWILTILQRLTKAVSEDLDNYRFAESYDRIYHFVWDDFADWYIEASKANPNTEVLEYVLTTVLKVMHPFAPFVTEAIWQELDWYEGLLAIEAWPEVPAVDTKAAKQFDEIKAVVSELRQLSRAMKLTKPTLLHQEVGFMETNGTLIQRLARLGSVELLEANREGLKLSGSSLKVWLEIEASDIRRYAGELREKQAELKQSIAQLKSRLGNRAYISHAPAKVVQETRDQLDAAQTTYGELSDEIKRFS